MLLTHLSLVPWPGQSMFLPVSNAIQDKLNADAPAVPDKVAPLITVGTIEKFGYSDFSNYAELLFQVKATADVCAGYYALLLPEQFSAYPEVIIITEPILNENNEPSVPVYKKDSKPGVPGKVRLRSIRTLQDIMGEETIICVKTQ